jgi:hypothetical protein
LRQLLQASGRQTEALSQIVVKLRAISAPKDEPFIFTTDLAENEKLLREVFQVCDDIIFRPFNTAGKKAMLVFLDGMVDKTLLEESVLKVLMALESNQVALSIKVLINNLITNAALKSSQSAQEAIESVLKGYTLLLVDGVAEALLIGAEYFVKRSVEEAKVETVTRGAHDAFNETLRDNIVLLRRRTRDPDVKVKIRQVGTRSKTDLAIVYAASLVKPGLVAELERRLEAIHADQFTNSGELEEWIVDRPWSPFPQTHATERPDTFLSAIYEGRVGLILDNTPHCLLVPCTFSNLLASAEDHAIQPVVASFIRITRYVSAFIGIFLPAVYIAIVSYHPGMLPTTLAISVAELRARTPYPAWMEVLLMEGILEIFQEAVVRLPQKISPAASIVGGFVIGTTIVQAGIVNALLVVAIAGTAIASYTMPSYNLGLALRWFRVPTIILSSILGFYGVVIGYLAIVIHLCGLRSFGESYLGGLFDITLLEDMHDKLIRVPASIMGSRPKQFGPRDRTRVGD